MNTVCISFLPGKSIYIVYMFKIYTGKKKKKKNTPPSFVYHENKIGKKCAKQ